MKSSTNYLYEFLKEHTAEKGNGSYLNNQRMRVSSRSKLEDSIIFTGGPRRDSKDRNVVLDEYKKFSSEEMLLISVEEGFKILDIEAVLTSEQRIIRAMPNTPSAVGKGITALIGNSAAKNEHILISKILFLSGFLKLKIGLPLTLRNKYHEADTLNP